MEIPMLILGILWLILLILEFTKGLSSFLENVGIVIWILFILDFILKFTLAPQKKNFLKANWLGIVALILPALRVFRIFQAFRFLRLARAARGLRFARVLTSLNRGMKALGKTMGKRGFGYVLCLTVIVTFGGAAGMMAFEKDFGLSDYGTALWWTAMIMTTMGSEYWPKSGEGRLLCLLLALYSFTVFGYLTAVLASYFVERDENEKKMKSEAKEG